MSEYTHTLRLKHLLHVVPISKAHVYALIKAGEFPRPFKLSKHAVAWDAAEIQQWIDDRKAKSR